MTGRVCSNLQNEYLTRCPPPYCLFNQIGLRGSLCLGKFAIMISDCTTSGSDATGIRRNFQEITLELGERHFRLIQT